MVSKQKERSSGDCPAYSPGGDAKTVTSSEFLAYQGTNMECI